MQLSKAPKERLKHEIPRGCVIGWEEMMGCWWCWWCWQPLKKERWIRKGRNRKENERKRRRRY